jgi:hypothetical protein
MMGSMGAEEEAEDPLVHDPPPGVLRVGDVHGGIAGSLLDGLCQGHGGAVEMAMKAGTSESRHGDPLHNMKLWASRRTEREDNTERPAAVEALGTETIPYGEASMRAEEEDISRRRGGELAAAGKNSQRRRRCRWLARRLQRSPTF